MIAYLKRKFRFLVRALTAVLIFWLVMTIWVETKGPENFSTYGDSSFFKKALIIYDPDPIFNLDEQVCRMTAVSLANDGISSDIKTVSSAENSVLQSYDLYVFCSNTYNWQPDWAISDFIGKVDLRNREVICITLGSGSTETSRKKLEKIVIGKKGEIIGSRSLWLLRPNTESRMSEPNVQVALSEIYKWTHKVISDAKFNGFQK